MSVVWKKMSVAEIAAAICDHLNKRGFNAVLTGGACVSIYSDNAYQSSDIDFVMPEYSLADVDAALKEIGFTRQKGWRQYVNADCPFFIEFPTPPLAVGSELIKKTDELKTRFGILKIISPTDCVKDRLAAFYHWRDKQSLDQAVLVAITQKVNFNEIRRWSEVEGSIDKYTKFRGELKKYIGSKRVKHHH
jgi:hypothetical protein